MKKNLGGRPKRGLAWVWAAEDLLYSMDSSEPSVTVIGWPFGASHGGNAFLGSSTGDIGESTGIMLYTSIRSHCRSLNSTAQC